MARMSNYVGWCIYDYYQWLLEKIDGGREPYYNYSLLLHELHSIPFTYGMEMDQNRATAGERLRWEYMDEKLIPDVFYKDGIQCSVLEMMIALSLGCNDMMVGGEKGASKWFWMMIENLDLMKCQDDNFDTGYVHQQIRIWLDRAFKRNGEGSPFPLKKGVSRDQRKVDIWYQMCGYLSENFL